MASKESSEETLEEQALLVIFNEVLPTGSKEKICDRLQIHFQKRKLGGGDVDKVLYPLPGSSTKAIIVFSTESNADIVRLIRSKHVVDFGNGVKVDVDIEALPKMIQEVQLVINPFYWSLLPRDKTDEFKHKLQANASAHLEESSTMATIGIPNTQYIDAVKDVVAEVVGLKLDDKPDVSTLENEDGSQKESDDKRMNVGFRDRDHRRQQEVRGNSVDRSVRPKVYTAKNTSDHDDNMAIDEEHVAEQAFQAGSTSDETQGSFNMRQNSPEAAKRNPSHRMAAKFSNHPESTSASNSATYSMGSEFENNVEYGNQRDNADTIPSDDSCRGPFAVSTLLYKYLEDKHTKDMAKIRQNYGVKIECIPDKKQGGQGEVYIKSGVTKRPTKKIDQAADDFISLYQKCFQNIIIKPISCNGIGSSKIAKAISYVWKQQSSVLIEDSIDDEVTFIGEERQVSEAMKEFQKMTGLQPKSRKLKHPQEASSSSSSVFSMNTSEAQLSKSRASYAGATSMQQGASELAEERRFKTDEGIEVIVRKDDITRQHVDVIVNPSNGDLTLNEGVGGALLRVAGRELEVECKEIRRRKRRDFLETECVSSGGYDLPCRFVVHAYGPMYSRNTGYDRNQEDKFYSKLNVTFLNCLNEANDLKAQSIAVPLISSGAFGGPKEVCAKALIDAVKQYSKMESHKAINSICLVNKDDEAYDAIVKMMNWLTTNDTDERMDTSSDVDTVSNKPFWTEKLQTARNNPDLNSDVEMNRHPNAHRADSHDDTGMEKRKAYVTGNIQIIVEQQDILESVKDVDGIIVPTDSMLNNSGKLASTIARAARLSKDDLDAKTSGLGLREGDIIHTHGNDLAMSKLFLSFLLKNRIL
ncbi:uncharacterized protein [Amphiura filiformis]|uniref:uncharacterized protein n=1 Tax=Amphiura filiformis TaxID=82378 RepID=UPI003B2108F6